MSLTDPRSLRTGPLGSCRALSSATPAGAQGTEEFISKKSVGGTPVYWVNHKIHRTSTWISRELHWQNHCQLGLKGIKTVQSEKRPLDTPKLCWQEAGWKKDSATNTEEIWPFMKKTDRLRWWNQEPRGRGGNRENCSQTLRPNQKTSHIYQVAFQNCSRPDTPLWPPFFSFMDRTVYSSYPLSVPLVYDVCRGCGGGAGVR